MQLERNSQMLLVGLKLLTKSFEINTNITVQSSKSIGIEYRQLLAPKVSAIPQSILRLKTIADTVTDIEKVSAIPPIPILYHRY